MFLRMKTDLSLSSGMDMLGVSTLLDFWGDKERQSFLNSLNIYVTSFSLGFNTPLLNCRKVWSGSERHLILARNACVC